jgi:hypothetical protein
MKKLIIALACVAATVSTYAQGYVYFDTRPSTDSGFEGATVYDATAKAYCSGTGYLAQLYSYTGTTTDASLLTAAGTAVNFKSGTQAGYVATGTGVNSLGQATKTGVLVTTTTLKPSAGTTVTLQMRVWAGGTVANYEAAMAANGVYGSSQLFTMTAYASPATPLSITGLKSFTIGVPEPTTIALGVMGAAALLLRRRK